jgi:hypothetical protein
MFVQQLRTSNYSRTYRKFEFLYKANPVEVCFYPATNELVLCWVDEQQMDSFTHYFDFIPTHGDLQSQIMNFLINKGFHV